MKSIFLIAALLCGVSSASMALGSPVAKKPELLHIANLVKLSPNKKPADLACFSGAIGNRLSVVCYDNSISGDWLTALQIAIDYNCG